MSTLYVERRRLKEAAIHHQHGAITPLRISAAQEKRKRTLLARRASLSAERTSSSRSSEDAGRAES